MVMKFDFQKISFSFIHLQEKVKYYDMATEKRAEFDKAMIEYNKKKVYTMRAFSFHNLYVPFICLGETIIFFHILMFVLFFPSGNWRNIWGIRFGLVLKILEFWFWCFAITGWSNQLYITELWFVLKFLDASRILSSCRIVASVICNGLFVFNWPNCWWFSPGQNLPTARFVHFTVFFFLDRGNISCSCPTQYFIRERKMKYLSSNIGCSQ